MTIVKYVESSIPSPPYLIAVALAITIWSYLALTGSTVGLTTVQRDEFADLLIIVRLVNDFGPPSPVSDPSFIQRFGTQPVHQIACGRGI
jgi:hypothetical protein